MCAPSRSWALGGAEPTLWGARPQNRAVQFLHPVLQEQAPQPAGKSKGFPSGCFPRIHFVRRPKTEGNCSQPEAETPLGCGAELQCVLPGRPRPQTRAFCFIQRGFLGVEEEKNFIGKGEGFCPGERKTKPGCSSWKGEAERVPLGSM